MSLKAMLTRASLHGRGMFSKPFMIHRLGPSWHKSPCSCFLIKCMFSIVALNRPSVWPRCLLMISYWYERGFQYLASTAYGQAMILQYVEDVKLVWPRLRQDMTTEVSAQHRLMPDSINHFATSNTLRQQKVNFEDIWMIISEDRRQNLDAFKLLGQKSIPRLGLWLIKCARQVWGSNF